MARTRRPQQRFGIGEWYGKSFVTLTPEERRYFAESQQAGIDTPNQIASR